MKKVIFFSILTSLFFYKTSIVFATEAEQEFHQFKTQHNIDFSTTDTSDDLHFKTFSYKYQQPQSDLAWPYEGEPHSDLKWYPDLNWRVGNSKEDRFQIHELNMNFLKKISPKLSYQIIFGIDIVKNSKHEVQNYPHFAGFLNYSYEAFYVNLNIERRHALLRILGTKMDLQEIYIDSFIPHVQWKLSDRAKIKLHSEYQSLSDNNHFLQTELSYLYGFYYSKPWVWIGPILSQTSYSKESSAYWSPRSFNSYGLTSELAFELSDNVQSLFGASATKTLENETLSGKSYYLNAGLAFGNRNSSNFTIKLESSTSIQKSQWSSTGLYFNCASAL